MNDQNNFQDNVVIDEAKLFVVTDLKQYLVCPRVVYYERCLVGIRPRTYKMDAGRDAHDDEREKSARRVTRPYGIENGERLFEVRLTSGALGLTGRLDEMLIDSNGSRIPVDYKMTRSVGSQHRIQISAYAMLIEAIFKVPVSRGYIYLIPTRTRHEIIITTALRERVNQILHELKAMVERENFPDPPKNRSICSDCEFRRFCNDV